MAVSKANVLEALGTFKGLQDEANNGKFVAKEANKALISSDDQTKLNGIAAGAQVNVIEKITIDGTEQTITDKGVTLDLSAYVKGTDVASALVYKSSVNSYADLPTSGQKIGDVYNIRTAGGTDADGTPIKAGDNVVWNGTGWDVLAGTTDLSAYVEKVAGKQLSTEDYSTAEKTKLEGVEADADVNVIESVTVDGNALTPDANKAVNIDLSGKVDKVIGKQLSTEDFTTALKTKLEGITDETITTAEVQALFA